MFFTISDQIRTPHRLERLAQQGPVVRIVIAQERLVQAPLLQATGGEDFLAATAPDRLQRIAATVKHRRRQRHR